MWDFLSYTQGCQIGQYLVTDYSPLQYSTWVLNFIQESNLSTDKIVLYQFIFFMVEHNFKNFFTNDIF